MTAGQEQIHTIRNEDGDIQGVIAIHSTALGPAAGGCRMWRYANAVEMTADAVALARAMSFKNALAGLPFGGGKAVLQQPSGEQGRAELLRLFADTVERLGGRYITAEDVGTSVGDMTLVRQHTAHVAGLEAQPGMAGGDPSPWTALGVYKSMMVAVDFVLQTDLKGLRVAVQGVGSVGAELCRLLHRAGARLIVADIASRRAEAIASELNAEHVPAEKILRAECDVLAPCALGDVFTPDTIPLLNTRIICGAANNQLAGSLAGEELASRNITFCPDYLVNAGGIINVAGDYMGETSQRVLQRINLIPKRLYEVLNIAATVHSATNIIADVMAQEIIARSHAAAPPSVQQV